MSVKFETEKFTIKTNLQIENGCVIPAKSINELDIITL